MNPTSHSPTPTPHLLCAEGVRPGLWQSCHLWRVSVSEPADGLPRRLAIHCAIRSTHMVIPAAASSGVTTVKGRGTRPEPIPPSYSAS